MAREKDTFMYPINYGSKLQVQSWIKVNLIFSLSEFLRKYFKINLSKNNWK